MPIISLIAAISDNYVIGASNKLVWSMPTDFEYYKNTVRHKPIIMGRKTAQSEDMFLSERQNILITRDKSFRKDDFEIAFSLEEAIKKVKGEEVFITGGAQIYKMTLPIAEALYITRIHTKVQGDAYFPEFSENEWQLDWEEHHQSDKHNPFNYTFQRYNRRTHN